MSLRDGFIIVRNQYDGGQVIFNKQIERFSIILASQLGNYQSIYLIPKFLQLQTTYITLIKKFAQLHNYTPKQIQTPQVESLTQYSKICNPQTVSFLKQLQSLSNSELQKAYKTSNYFGVELLSRVICHHILEKYQLPVTDKEVLSKLKEYQVGDVGQFGVNDIKKRYFLYFKIYGQNLADLLQGANKNK